MCRKIAWIGRAFAADEAHRSASPDLDELRHLGAVGCAAALALAAVLAFAAVVAGLAAALSLAIVLAFTGVLGRLVLSGVAEAGLGRLDRGALRSCCAVVAA